MNETYYSTLDVLGNIAIGGWVIVAAVALYASYHAFICKRCKGDRV
jgi:hypothetical protein